MNSWDDPEQVSATRLEQLGFERVGTIRDKTLTRRSKEIRRPHFCLSKTKPIRVPSTYLWAMSPTSQTHDSLWRIIYVGATLSGFVSRVGNHHQALAAHINRGCVEKGAGKHASKLLEHAQDPQSDLAIFERPSDHIMVYGEAVPATFTEEQAFIRMLKPIINRPKDWPAPAPCTSGAICLFS